MHFLVLSKNPGFLRVSRSWRTLRGEQPRKRQCFFPKISPQSSVRGSVAMKAQGHDFLFSIMKEKQQKEKKQRPRAQSFGRSVCVWTPEGSGQGGHSSGMSPTSLQRPSTPRGRTIGPCRPSLVSQELPLKVFLQKPLFLNPKPWLQSSLLT